MGVGACTARVCSMSMLRACIPARLAPALGVAAVCTAVRRRSLHCGGMEHEGLPLFPALAWSWHGPCRYLPGEQVLLCYGKHTNLQLLEHYGFVLQVRARAWRQPMIGRSGRRFQIRRQHGNGAARVRRAVHSTHSSQHAVMHHQLSSDARSSVATKAFKKRLLAAALDVHTYGDALCCAVRVQDNPHDEAPLQPDLFPPPTPSCPDELQRADAWLHASGEPSWNLLVHLR